jgi:hypothetical protein
MYPYELEKGSKKHGCPNCGKKTFVRVIEDATGNYLPDHVGRCDRESNCGYQYTWKQYLADSPELRSEGMRQKGHYKDGRGPVAASISKNRSQAVYSQSFQTKKAHYLETRHLLDTLTDYEQNTFVKFLLKLFPNDADAVNQAVIDYLIGTKEGWAVFPTVSTTMKVCKAKLMKFDPDTGKRIKDADGKGVISSLQARLKAAGKLDLDFETDKDVFFGEHLLQKIPGFPIAIVEAEKTAVLASICKGAFPCDFIWLATGSKQWLKADRLTRLGRDRTIILYPDADGFDKWQETASDARKSGLTVKVSNLIEGHATDAEKAKQADLADYLIGLQIEIDRINARIEGAKANPKLLADIDTICEERKSILIYDGQLTDEEAEAYVSSSDFLRDVIQSIWT